MQEQIIFIVLHAITILPLFGISWYFKKFPPKQINSWYGYRTRSSMRNQETWLEANTFSADRMFKAVLFSLIVSITTLIVLQGELAFIVTLIFHVSSLLGVIVATEIQMKKLFHKDGTRKNKAL